MTGTLELWRPYRLDSTRRSQIDSLRPLLEECDREAAKDRRFPLRGIEAMIDAGFFKLALPREVGGEECHPVLEMELYEAVSRISVSACWNLLVGNIHSAWAAAYLSDEAVAEMFPKGHRTVVAGQAAPTGKGRRVSGGYRVTGRWSWGSGITHANWVMGGFGVEGGDELFVYVTPKSTVSVLDNWHVVGIEGSGSFDYAAEDLFVPGTFCYPFYCTNPKRGGARFSLPWPAQATVPHTSVAMGGGQHAFEAIGTLAAKKGRSNSKATLAERGAFQRDLGQTYVHMCAARDHAARLFERMSDCAAAGEQFSKAETDELVAMAASVDRLMVDVANMAFRYAGGASVRLDSPIQRCLRDVLVAQQHLAVTDTSLEELGKAIIEQLKGSVEPACTRSKALA